MSVVMEARDSEPVLATPHDEPGPGVVARWAPFAVALAGTVGALLIRDTAPFDIGRYLLYLVWALMLPGTLVYRSLRRSPHSLVDDLAMGTALGCVLELGAWAVYTTAGLGTFLWTWPAVVVVVFLAVPRLRKYWRVPVGYRQPSLGWSWALAGIVAVTVAFFFFNIFRIMPFPRDKADWYYLDSMYLLSLVGESKHHVPLHVPQVATEPLNYHWFSYAHMAASSLTSGVDAPVVYFRLAMPFMWVLAIVLMAVTGWRISGKPWVGVLSSALMFIVAEFAMTGYPMFSWVARWAAVISPSICYAWLSLIPLILLCADRIRRSGLPDAAFGRGAWILLGLFAAAAAGAKATGLFVLLAGLAVAGLMALLRREFPARVIVTGLIVSVVVGLAVVVLFGGDSGGMKLQPLQMVSIYLPPGDRGPAGSLLVLGFMSGAYAIYMLARLAGVPVLIWLAWRDRKASRWWSDTHWFLLGALLAGLAATHLLWHMTWAQTNMLRSAWPFGVLLSAMGLAALVRRHQISPKMIGWITASAIVATAVVGFALEAMGLAMPGPGSRVVAPIYWSAIGVALVAAAVAVVVLLSPARRRLSGVASVAMLSLVLLAGIPVLGRDIADQAAAVPTADGSAFYAERITPDGIAMAEWIKANVPPDEVLATNAHCRAGVPVTPDCQHLTFWLSAYAERRLVVGGWGYTPRSVVEAAAYSAWPGYRPFFEPRKLEVNDAAFQRPDPAVLAELRDRYGANWLVVDRTAGWEAAELASLVPLRFERGDYAVYELR